MGNYNHLYFTFHRINLFGKKQIDEMVKLVGLFHRGGQLFEIGCGDGRLLEVLSKSYDVRAVDISEAAISRAGKNVDKNRLRIMDIEHSSIEGQYDIVLALNVLEHLKQPEAVIIKVRNSLRRDGVFIFSVPNKYFFGKIPVAIMNWFDKTHISVLERNRWIELVKESGFRPVQILNGVIYRPFKWDFAKYFASTMVMVAEKTEQGKNSQVTENKVY